MGFLGILLGLALLVWFAFRGWSVLLLAPAAALLAAAFAGEPLLAHWTQTFMGSAAQFLAQFFPLFLLGALFGKLMEDSGSVTAIAAVHDGAAGRERAMLAVVLAGALVTYGGVSLFVAFFVLAPMAAGAVSRRCHSAPADAGGDRAGHLDLHHVGAAGHARDPERHPDAVLRHHALRGARPRHDRLGHHAGLRPVVAGTGRAAARRPARAMATMHRRPATPPPKIRWCVNARRRRTRSTRRRSMHGQRSRRAPPICWRCCRWSSSSWVNLLMSFVVLPRMDAAFLAEPRWGGTSLSAVGGVWSVAVALAAAIVVLLLDQWAALAGLAASMDAGANAAVLPALSVASLVGFGAVVAALPAFAIVREWVLGIEGGPLVSLAIATNILAALTGSASGGLTIALDALGPTYMRLAAETRHRSGADASRGGDRRGHARQPAAQRRGGDLARGLRLDASRELFRHRHGRHRGAAAGAGCRDRSRQRVRVVLNGPTSYSCRASRPS